MITDLRKKTELATASIEGMATMAHQTVAAKLHQIQEDLPQAVRQLSHGDRHEAAEELRRGYNIWLKTIDPILSDLEKLLRNLDSEVFNVNREEPATTPILEEDEMEWTQSGRDRKKREEEFQASCNSPHNNTV